MQMAALMAENDKKEMGRLAKKRINKLKPKYAVRNLERLYKYVISKSRHKKQEKHFNE
jgi:hypothetical protein